MNRIHCIYLYTKTNYISNFGMIVEGKIRYIDGSIRDIHNASTKIDDLIPPNSYIKFIY